MAAVLFQQGESKDERRIISYASAKFTPTERRYHINEQEVLAATWAIRKYRMMLQDNRFTLYTDNRSLLWLKKYQDERAKLTRWALMLQGYQFDVVHVPGRLNELPDFLSRYPEESEGIEQPLDDDHLHPALNAIERTPLFEEIAGMQRADDACHLEYLEVERVRRTRAEGKREQRIAREFAAREGLLWKVLRDGRLLLRVPEAGVERVLAAFHEDALAGHPGRDETLLAIRKTYYWPKMAKDVADYVKSCHICAATKRGPPQQRAPLRPHPPTKPWHTVSLDIIGPYQEAPKRSRFAAVITDTFSKWVEVRPIVESTVKHILPFLEDVFSRFGYPAVIITDNAAQFTGRKWDRYLRNKHVRAYTSPVYHQRANPVERKIQEVKKTIRAAIIEKPTSWDHDLSSTLFALRNRTNAATGTTPAALLFGQDLKRPGEWVKPAQCQPPVRPVNERVRSALRRQIVYQRQLYPEPRTAPLHFNVGDLVMTRVRPGAGRNFAPKWSGPHPVTEVLSDGVYRVDQNGNEQPIHIDDIRPAPQERPQRLRPAELTPRPGPMPRRVELTVPDPPVATDGEVEAAGSEAELSRVRPAVSGADATARAPADADVIVLRRPRNPRYRRPGRLILPLRGEKRPINGKALPVALPSQAEKAPPSGSPLPAQRTPPVAESPDRTSRPVEMPAPRYRSRTPDTTDGEGEAPPVPRITIVRAQVHRSDD